MEGNKIADDSYKSLIAFFILSLIPLGLSLLKYVNNTLLFVALFALDFLIAGIVSTKAKYPLLSLREILSKVKLIVLYGLIFSVVSVVLIYYMKMTASSILVFMSIISFILILIAYIRTVNSIQIIENPEEYNEKNIIRIIYVLAIYCVVAYIGMEVPPFSVIPLWFGLCVPFIVLIPGYLALNIINPYKDDIRTIDRIGISFFVSLLITSTIGLMLVQIENFLNMRHVSMVLAVVVLIIFLPLYYIRIKEKKTHILFSDIRLNRIFILMTVIAIIAVISSGILVSTGSIGSSNNDPGSLFQGNTSFEITGIHETPDSDGYYNFTDGEDLNLTVDITNEENRDMTYRLKIDIMNDTSNKTFSNEKITLKDNENKKIETNLTMTTGKKDIRFTLYDDNNQAYKIRHLYVNVKEY